MSWVDLYRMLDERGLVDAAAVARELANLGYGEKPPGGDSKPGADQGAPGGGSEQETASEGCCGAGKAVSR